MSNIEWTDETWNPVVGCTPVSPGCLNCYAATMARRLEGMDVAGYEPRAPAEELPERSRGERLIGVWCRCGGEVWFEKVEASRGWAWEAFCRKCKACDANGYGSRKQLLMESPMFWGDRRIRIAEVKAGRAVFTGEVRTIAGRLTEPMGWRDPRRVFVCSMSDLFHESVPFEFIDQVWAVMALCPRHTFQVLTKRPDRMAAYLNGQVGHAGNGRRERVLGQAWSMAGDMNQLGRLSRFARDRVKWSEVWPLPNVWLGTSTEDQTRADQRIPQLLRCPAVVRFLSVEPLLAGVNLCLEHEALTDLMDAEGRQPGMRGRYPLPGAPMEARTRRRHCLHWVIVGGESGAHARPCDVGWIRGVVQQCRAAGVPVFVKQLGTLPFADAATATAGDLAMFSKRLKNRKGGDPSEWPEDLRVREWPEVKL